MRAALMDSGSLDSSFNLLWDVHHKNADTQYVTLDLAGPT